jgi:dGTPase
LPFTVTVECACLLHDIGNPPFGHLGEFAIRDWFVKNQTEILDQWKRFGISEPECKYYLQGLTNFDGNAQGFRIVTKLQWLEDEYGLNLTCSLLASMVKYLGCAPDDGAFKNKVGYFDTEKNQICEIWDSLNLKKFNDTPSQRHPLVFIMEAADDIAYCLSDIEDAIEKNIVSETLVLKMFDSIMAGILPPKEPKHDDYKVSQNRNFIVYKAAITRYFVDKAAELFLDKRDSILGGLLSESLLESNEETQTKLEAIKSFTTKYVFSAKEAINIELSGYKIIHELLDSFKSVLFAYPVEFNKLLPDPVVKSKKYELALEKRLFSLIPNKHLINYKFSVENCNINEPVYRAHMIVDYISGMTDSHAVKIFKMLKGITIGEAV